MAIDLRIVVPNRPGTVAATLEVLFDAGVNVSAACGDIRPGERWGFIHILVEEADKARAALDNAGLEISAEHDVEISKVPDQPGGLLELLKSYSDADRNIEVLYTSSKGVVVGTEDMLKPRYGVRMEDTTN